MKRIVRITTLTFGKELWFRCRICASGCETSGSLCKFSGIRIGIERMLVKDSSCLQFGNAASSCPLDNKIKKTFNLALFIQTKIYSVYEKSKSN